MVGLCVDYPQPNQRSSHGLPTQTITSVPPLPYPALPQPRPLLHRNSKRHWRKAQLHSFLAVSEDLD